MCRKFGASELLPLEPSMASVLAVNVAKGRLQHLRFPACTYDLSSYDHKDDNPEGRFLHNQYDPNHHDDAEYVDGIANLRVESACNERVDFRFYRK